MLFGRRPDWYFENGKHGGTINDIAIHAFDAIKFMFGIDVDKVIGARCWNKFAESEPDFKDSAQLMVVANNGAGIIGDVSYSIPDGVEFELPYYWQFYLWGTKGVVSFSLNEKESFYYISGDKTAQKLCEKEVGSDFLTDFYHMVTGKENVILSMQEVFDSTRQTLRIQELCI